MTFTGTYVIAFIFCSESPVLQVQNGYCLYFTKSTFMAGLLALERTTSLLQSALHAVLCVVRSSDKEVLFVTSRGKS